MKIVEVYKEIQDQQMNIVSDIINIIVINMIPLVNAKLCLYLFYAI